MLFAICVAGIPELYQAGQEGDFRVLVIQLMGSSLEEIKTRCKGQLSLKTVCMLAIQMIRRVQQLHESNFLHRDLKPENFMMGLEGSKDSDTLFLIDYGLAKRWKNRKSGIHIPMRDGKQLIGTVRYASLNSHLGIEQSRRDDLESIGFILVYLIKGSLPWQGIQCKDKKEKH